VLGDKVLQCCCSNNIRKKTKEQGKRSKEKGIRIKVKGWRLEAFIKE